MYWYLSVGLILGSVFGLCRVPTVEFDTWQSNLFGTVETMMLKISPGLKLHPPLLYYHGWTAIEIKQSAGVYFRPEQGNVGEWAQVDGRAIEHDGKLATIVTRRTRTELSVHSSVAML